MKTKRGLSGCYFRAKIENNKYEPIVFEELSEEQQDKILDTADVAFLKGLAKQLANTLNKIGDEFDIIQA